jgi:hypothetical protein
LGNWIIWYWVIMMISSLGQLGGIVGGVGQSLAISMPLTQAGRDYNQMMQRRTEMEVRQAELRLRQRENSSSARDEVVRLQAEVDALRKTMQDAAQSDTRYQTIFDIWQAEQRLAAISDRTQAAGKTQAQQIAAELKPLRAQLESYGHAVGEDRTWACIVTVVTAIILVLGRYRFIETATTTFVAGFTAITVLNVFLLQLHPAWAMTWDDLRSGLTFQLPQSPSGAGGLGAVATALATFGIIGVGTNELLAYPYFCIEKGYARFTGPRDKTEDWAARARGWMRVMRVDAWCSMVVYTFATVAFYILGPHPGRHVRADFRLLRAGAVFVRRFCRALLHVLCRQRRPRPGHGGCDSRRR